MKSLKVLGRNHMRGLGVFRERLNFPDQIGDAINEINSWIKSNGLAIVQSPT